MRRSFQIQRKMDPSTVLYRYPTNKEKYLNLSLQTIAVNCQFYKKKIPKSGEVGADASFNLVRLKEERGIALEEAHLVFLSKKFSLTDPIGTNKYGLCVEDFPDFVFILRFRDHLTAVEFISTAIDYVRMDGVYCPLNWLTEEQKRLMDRF